MKAISTRYIGATDRKPARILATDLDGNRISIAVDSDQPFPYNDMHRAAAVALCRKMGWPGAERLIGGSVKVGMVWVFSHESAPADLLRRVLPMLVQLGDYIGNGPIDPARADSLGARCDLIGDIGAYLHPDGEP